MTSKELKERLDKSLINVEKRKSTIEKQKKQVEKKKAVLERVDWIDIDNLNAVKWDEDARKRYVNEVNETYKDALYWDACDYESACETVKDSYKKLEELEKIASNWSDKLTKAVEKENTIASEMPEIFRELKDSLVTEWNKYDKELRKWYSKRLKELGYTDFIHEYHYSNYEMISKSDEQIDKENVKAAENVIIDLFNRVKDITGEVTDWNNIYSTAGNHGFVVLNGWVKGVEGKAKVESILASGPVQRLHVRTLVHRM